MEGWMEGQTDGWMEIGLCIMVIMHYGSKNLSKYVLLQFPKRFHFLETFYHLV